jgi:hypothetical protein
MADKQKPYQVIADMVAARSTHTDDEVLAELASLTPLADETDPCWDNDVYWHQSGYLYVALADIAAVRRLRPAIKMLLDRACYGDPGEIMRGLRHSLEAIVNPDWTLLADICLGAAQSPRLGTRLWAIHQLTVLEDPRAKPIFEEAIAKGREDVRNEAKRGLRRLAN